MPCPPDDIALPPRPSLSVDWELYAAMLEDNDMPLERQKELIETLWSIVVMFVDLGFDLKPAPQICGEDQEGLDDESIDLVCLFNRQAAQMHAEEEVQWQD